MPTDDKPTFTQEDLAEIDADDGGQAGGSGGQAAAAQDGAGKEGSEAGKGADPAKGEGDGKPAADAKPADGKPAAAGKAKATIAGGAEVSEEDKAAEEAAALKAAAKIDRNELSEDLRKLIASHYAAGDKKVEAKELKRLERIKDVASLWGMYRELEAKFTGGGLIKKPGKDAKPEEIAEYHKALGVPEKPEDYLKDIKLENGAVIGEADKPLIDGFAKALHQAGAPPSVMQAALNWYYKNQEDAAAAVDEADDKFRREAETALKEEFGPAFKRKINSIGTIFATAPGGTDLKNEGSLYFRLMNGRTADGKIIANDPDMIRFLATLASEVNPAVSVVEDGAQGGMSLEQEIEKIEKIMRENRREYNQRYATRYGELLAAREKIQARNRA